DEHLLGGRQADSGKERDKILGEAAALEQAEEEDGAGDRAAIVAAAAQDESEPDEERLLGQEHVRLDVGEVVAGEDAGWPGDGGPGDKGLEVEADHVLAGDRGHCFVLADGAQDASKWRAANALEGEVHDSDGEPDEAKVEEIVVSVNEAAERPRDAGDAIGAA